MHVHEWVANTTIRLSQPYRFVLLECILPEIPIALVCLPFWEIGQGVKRTGVVIYTIIVRPESHFFGFDVCCLYFFVFFLVARLYAILIMAFRD